MAAIESVGILLVNLGTPALPTPLKVGKFLNQFLADRRVVEISPWLWQPILKCLILPFRSPKSAKLYQKIWTANGSPLLYFSQLQAQKLQEIFSQHQKLEIKVALGMSYGSPSIAAALAELKASHIQQLLVFPLYPQYSSTTVGSVFDAVAQVLKTWRFIPKLHMITHYADHHGYIAALANSIRNYWQSHTPGERLLFSFHGLPERNILAGDPYFHQCHTTASLVAQKLQLATEQWQVVFQSRFGVQKWLQPYCNISLQALAAQGVKTVDVICPGFAADCLETLEEMEQTNQEVFIRSGGEKLNYIPALNAHPEHIAALADIALTYIT